MIRPVLLVALIGMAALGATPVFATDTPEQQQLKRLQQQIDQMRQDYEARLNALEARVRQAEAGSSAAAAPLQLVPHLHPHPLPNRCRHRSRPPLHLLPPMPSTRPSR
jgi:type II secretory pathway pseudopilin PulG